MPHISLVESLGLLWLELRCGLANPSLCWAAQICWQREMSKFCFLEPRHKCCVLFFSFVSCIAWGWAGLALSVGCTSSAFLREQTYHHTKPCTIWTSLLGHRKSRVDLSTTATRNMARGKILGYDRIIFHVNLIFRANAEAGSNYWAEAHWIA